MNNSETKITAYAPPGAYVLTLIIFFIGSNYLSGRVWGIDIWNDSPGALALLLLGGGLGALIWFLPSFHISNNAELSSGSNRTYSFISLGLIIISTLAFYFFRAQTHFLGDGYTLLSLLGADNPLIKQREIGESLIHIWVKNIFGLSGENGALKAFQIISISAGALYAAVSAYAGYKLFEKSAQRALFALGLICAGHAPLFFGNVENYSVFALSVLLLSLLGALSASGALSKYWLLPALAFSIWLHALGVTLIPGVLYIIVKDTRAGRLLPDLSLRWKLSLLALTMALFAAVFIYIYQSNIFFEAALLPISESRFTVEGYTLLSGAHLLDLANLLIMLCPWALLALGLMISSGKETIGERNFLPTVRFLMILSASTMSAVFLFDPKLGMPRDWDLFSFAVIPVTFLFYYLVLNSKHVSPLVSKIAALSVALSLLILIPRISAGVDQQIAVKRLEAFINLDKKKNRTAMQLLQNFHTKRGDTAAVASLSRRYIQMYPEVALTRRATKLGQSGQIDSAFALLHEVLTVNPMYAPAYLNLGRAYRAQKTYDSALYYLEIADGLNPYNEYIIAELGQVFQELGDLYLKAGKLENARGKYRRAVERGMDSSLLSK